MKLAAPSPRLARERVGVRGTFEMYGEAPSPDRFAVEPLPARAER
jgi:hypothetical protein